MATIRSRKERIIWMEWNVSPVVLASDLDSWMKRLEELLFREFVRAAMDVRSYAQREHPWTNRTGDAERGLTVDVRWEGSVLRMDLSHTVHYGVFLERRWGGKWGVIPMSIGYGAARVNAALNAVMRGMA